MQVLIAEDDPISRRLLQSFLQGWGYAVTPAADGGEAWSRFQSGDYSLVITDWVMPGLDGLELVRKIRASPRGAYTYLLLLTAKSETRDLVEAMDAGADDFVGKPFEREELRARIRAAERILRLQQNLAAQNRALARARDELEERVRERTAELLQAEAEKKRFYREVIRAVTGNRLYLVDAGEIPEAGTQAVDATVDGPQAFSDLRACVREVAGRAGMAGQAVEDLVLAVGEATTNAIKHAAGGRCAVFVTDDRIIVRVSDRGSGIRPEDLPASVLTPGFSTQISLGMGYTMILALVDRVWLATGTAGTVVQLEKWIDPDICEPDPLLTALERF